MSSRTATLVLAVAAALLLVVVAGTSASSAELSSGSGSSGPTVRLAEDKPSQRWSVMKESHLRSARGLQRMAMAQEGSQAKCSVDRPCRDGKTCCRNGCRNVATDAANCGKCYRVCKQGQSCCNGACRSLKSDRYNCGGCGRICVAHTACDKGMCGYSS